LLKCIFNKKTNTQILELQNSDADQGTSENRTEPYSSVRWREDRSAV